MALLLDRPEGAGGHRMYNSLPLRSCAILQLSNRTGAAEHFVSGALMHSTHRAHRIYAPLCSLWPLCSLCPMEYVDAPHFPAASCRVSTKPPARVPVSCMRRAAMC